MFSPRSPARSVTGQAWHYRERLSTARTFDGPDEILPFLTGRRPRYASVLLLAEGVAQTFGGRPLTAGEVISGPRVMFRRGPRGPGVVSGDRLLPSGGSELMPVELQEVVGGGQQPPFRSDR